MKIRSSLTALLFCILFLFSFFTVPDYVECQELYPDECLDLFGKIDNPLASIMILPPHAVAFSYHIYGEVSRSEGCHSGGSGNPEEHCILGQTRGDELHKTSVVMYISSGEAIPSCSSSGLDVQLTLSAPLRC